MNTHTSMKDTKSCVDFDNLFYGSATIGERGQIVIPAEARAEMDLEPGDKVLIMRPPFKKGLVITKLEAARGFIEDFQRSLDRFEKKKDQETE